MESTSWQDHHDVKQKILPTCANVSISIGMVALNSSVWCFCGRFCITWNGMKGSVKCLLPEGSQTICWEWDDDRLQPNASKLIACFLIKACKTLQKQGKGRTQNV